MELSETTMPKEMFMTRTKYLKSTVGNVLGTTLTMFLGMSLLYAASTNQVPNLVGVVGLISILFLMVYFVVAGWKNAASRLLDIAPGVDRVLLYCGFLIGMILTGGFLGLALFIVPSGFIKGAK